MGLFRRHRTPEPSADGPRDEWLTPLSVDQAAAACRMVREHLASRGREGVIHEGTVRLDDGSSLGLLNLSHQLAATAYRQWPSTVANHVDRILASFEHKQDTPVAPHMVLARLRRMEDIPNEPGYRMMEPLPGIAAPLAVDYPDTVAELFGGDLTPVGGDAAAAYRLAHENLTDLPLPEHTAVLADDEKPTSAIHAFITEDFFGAARLLVLPDLLRRTIGEEIPPHGVLVAVPNRHLLIVHIPRDVSIIAAAQLMIQMGEREHDERPGPVSREIYHVGPDLAATQFSSHEDDKVVMRVEGPISDMFAALGLTE